MQRIGDFLLSDKPLNQTILGTIIALCLSPVIIPIAISVAHYERNYEAKSNKEIVYIILSEDDRLIRTVENW